MVKPKATPQAEREQQVAHHREWAARHQEEAERTPKTNSPGYAAQEAAADAHEHAVEALAALAEHDPTSAGRAARAAAAASTRTVAMVESVTRRFASGAEVEAAWSARWSAVEAAGAAAAAHQEAKIEAERSGHR